MVQATQATAADVLGGVVASDLPRGVALLGELGGHLATTTATFTSLADTLGTGDLHTAMGLSLLEVKNHALLSYLADLAYLTLTKLKGRPIQHSPAIERLVENRLVLERLRPLEDKLKYQIDKHVKTAAEGTTNQDDPSRLKGNLDNIGSSSEEEEEEEEEGKPRKDKKEEEENKVYKIPRISKMPYGEQEGERGKERARRRVLGSSMLREALQEHTDDPEVVHNADVLKQHAIRKRRQLEAYEEENMIRKTVSRGERAAMRQITTVGTLGSELLSFSSLNPLHPSQGPPTKKPRTSKPQKSKKGKKGFKKRKKH